jgi:hypothetical protein
MIAIEEIRITERPRMAMMAAFRKASRGKE